MWLRHRAATKRTPQILLQADFPDLRSSVYYESSAGSICGGDLEGDSQ
jgi:hypothetical protein